MASFYVTYHLEKIINMSYVVFYKKNSSQKWAMRYEDVSFSTEMS